MIRIDNRRRRAFMAMLAAFAAAMFITGYAQTQRVERLTEHVNTATQKSLYEAEELMAGVQLNLQKLLVSNSDSHRLTILDDIIRQSEAAADDLAGLGGGRETLEGAIKFTNQVGDYSRTLSKRLSLGEQVDQADINQMEIMLKSCVDLNQQLIQGIRMLEAGEIDLALSDNSPETETEPAVNYPVLLYDGPFSDAAGDVEFVPYGNEISSDEAARILTEFIGSDRVENMALTGESDIMSKCYEFEIDTPSGTLDAGVTAFGGYVLYMLPETGVTEISLSVDECLQRGLNFLSGRGFGRMHVSYWRRQDGIVTVNYVPVMDGVILYPELVKLQISLADGEIVGVEMGNYIRNHIDRVVYQPVIDEAEAMARVSGNFAVNNIELCVIPLDTSEYLCWEIRGAFEGADDFLIYIDAINAQERTILRLVQTDDGVLTQ
ncbi:MAG: germination protein YpeB [Clostridia bacterium]|nr:germination protein YpeB [Clostridia bacterium]